jgi:hypothetical protein
MSKLPLKDILEAVDQGGRDLWDLFDDEQKKDVKFFLMNRYVSAVRTSNREVQEHFVLATNEYFNKHFFALTKHPKLLWQLLCACGYENRQAYNHEWIGNKKKEGEGKKLKFLMKLHPSMKIDELEVMAELYTPKELKALAREQCWDEKEIAKYF